MLTCAQHQQQQQQQQQGCGQLSEQLAALNINQSDASPQQQQQQQHQLHSDVVTAFDQLHVNEQQQTNHQQQQQQEEQEAATQRTVWLRKSAHGQSCEGVLSCYPSCKPQPSTARKAQQLLAQGRAVAALLRLCPASSSLLLTYAAQARNAALLQQLIALGWSETGQKAFLYPRNDGLARVLCSRVQLQA
jgi:ATP-dependent Clp protease ATP-binding subunit ClpA